MGQYDTSFIKMKQKNTTLLDHLPNPIRKNVEKQKNTTLLEHLPNPIRKTVESDKMNTPTHIYMTDQFLDWYRDFNEKWQG